MQRCLQAHGQSVVGGLYRLLRLQALLHCTNLRFSRQIMNFSRRVLLRSAGEKFGIPLTDANRLDDREAIESVRIILAARNGRPTRVYLCVQSAAVLASEINRSSAASSPECTGKLLTSFLPSTSKHSPAQNCTNRQDHCELFHGRTQV